MSHEPDLPEIGTFVTDADLVIRGWNASLSHLTGIAGDDACGRPLHDIAVDLEARGLLEVCHRVLRTGSVEVLAPAVHHGLIPCPPRTPSAAFARMQQRVTIGPLRDGSAIVGLIFTVEDVTGRRDRERELIADLRSADPAVRLRAARRLGESDIIAPGDIVRAGVTDEDWRVRHTAVEGLRRRRRDALLASILTALRHQHHNVNVVSSALHVLALDGVDVLDPLLEFLSSPDADLRIQAALVLGLRRDPRATGALVRALDDPDVNVRFHAIEALGRIGARDAAGRLAAVAASRDFFLGFVALEALGRLGDARLTPVLLPLLDDPALGEAAADALARVGDERVAQALIDAMDRPEPGLPALVRALATLHERLEGWRPGGGAPVRALLRHSAGARVQKLLAAVASAGDAAPGLALVLGCTEDPAVLPGLLDLLHVAAARPVALEMLVRFGPSAVAALIGALDAADLDVRRSAMAGLGRIGGPEAKAALLGLVGTEPELLDDLAPALAALADADAIDALVRLLEHEESAARRAAVGALETVDHPHLAARVGDLMADPDPRRRATGVRLASRVAGHALTAALLERCRDVDEEVRRAALRAIAEMKVDGAEGVLLEAITGDTPKVRAVAARALASFDGDDVLTALMAGLADTDAWVRYYSARALGQRGDAEATAALVRLVQADAAIQVRIAAIEALGQLGRLDAVAPLGAVVESGDCDLVRPAVRALAAIEGTACRAVLLSVRHAPDPDRRIELLEGIAEAALDGAADELRAASLDDPDARVVEVVVQALARLAGSPHRERDAAVAALVQLSTDATPRADVPLRDLAAAALGRLRRSEQSPC